VTGWFGSFDSEGRASRLVEGQIPNAFRARSPVRGSAITDLVGYCGTGPCTSSWRIL
jgi:hypothetical protein